MMTMEMFIASTAKSLKRVPGTAIFLSASPRAVPPALLHNVKHNKVLHERVIVLTVLIEQVPARTGGSQERGGGLADGFHRIILRYGFMDEDGCACRAGRYPRLRRPVPQMETSYFLGRQTHHSVGAAGHGDLARAIVRVDGAQRRKRDGILQAAHQPRGRTGEPGGNLIAAPHRHARQPKSPRGA
jgi:K+ transporter